MTPRLTIFLIVLSGLGLTSCHADSVAEPDIRKCSQGRFRINAYLETAAMLEAMPKSRAINLLKQWAHTSHGVVIEKDPDTDFGIGSCDYKFEVIALCRMLFTPEPGETLRRPNIGGTFFIGGPRSVGGSGSEDPDGTKIGAMYGKLLDPIALIDGIPLLVSNGYFGSGPRPETAAEYLDYCIASGVWGKIPFRKATKEEMEAAIRKYQKDYAIRPLDKMEKNELNDQMKEPGTRWDSGWHLCRFDAPSRMTNMGSKIVVGYILDPFTDSWKETLRFPESAAYLDFGHPGDELHHGETLVIKKPVTIALTNFKGGPVEIKFTTPPASHEVLKNPPQVEYPAFPRVVVFEGTPNAYSDTVRFEAEQKKGQLIASLEEFFHVDPLALRAKDTARVAQLLRKARPNPQQKLRHSGEELPQALFKVILDDDVWSYHLYGSDPYIVRLMSERGEVMFLDTKERQELLGILNRYKRHGVQRP